MASAVFNKDFQHERITLNIVARPWRRLQRARALRARSARVGYAAPAMIVYPVGEDFAGIRLDKYLRQLLAAVPASHLFKMIRLKRVKVNGRRAQPGQLLVVGDQIEVRAREEDLAGPKSPDARRQVAPKVLFEDDWIMAIDKPPGMAVHPGTGITTGTVVDVVRAYLGPRATRNEFNASPAHRLDRDTSGVLLIAKRRRAMVHLTNVFTARAAKKRYLALVKGTFSQRNGRVDIPLAEHEQSLASRRKRGTNLQEAKTRWQALDRNDEVTLLRCAIETGRNHQIRRHFSAIEHPVVGDAKHGDFHFNREAKARWGLRRLFLHAEHLEFPHPSDQHVVVIDAPLPLELKEVLSRAGLAQLSP